MFSLREENPKTIIGTFNSSSRINPRTNDKPNMKRINFPLKIQKIKETLQALRQKIGMIIHKFQASFDNNPILLDQRNHISHRPNSHNRQKIVKNLIFFLFRKSRF